MSAPPFTYFGGKTRIAPRIAALLPEHGHYVEPFAGSLAVLLAKPASAMETVNDLDGDLMLFWRVLRDRPEDLMRVCALTPHSRAEHDLSMALDGDELERARRVWVRISQGRTGTLRKTGWRHYIDPAGSSVGMPGYLDGYVDRMAAVVSRLHAVSLESGPALNLIERYGRSPSVLLYVDPPYLGSTRSSGGYQVDMSSPRDHAELLDTLTRCRASVVLSGYASALYEDALDGWDRVEIPAVTSQGGANQARTEVIWSNRSIAPRTLFDAGATA